jgi:hypothetical protein
MAGRPWDRQRGESDPAWRAFSAYLAMEWRGSIDAVGRELYPGDGWRKRGRTGSLRRWARRHRWAERARAKVAHDWGERCRAEGDRMRAEMEARAIAARPAWWPHRSATEAAHWAERRAFAAELKIELAGLLGRRAGRE